MTFNLASILKDSTRRDPDHPAIIFDDVTLTYAQLETKSDRVASGLIEAGVRPGDVVGLQLPNIPEFAIALHGILKAGATIVPMNTLYKSTEIAYLLQDSGARHLITDSSSADQAAEALGRAGYTGLYVVGETPAGVAGKPFADLVDHELLDPVPFVQRQPGDTAILLYTSGTTGKPKGVQLTHFQLFMNAGAHMDAFEMNPSSKVIAVMPLFHALGLSGILNATVRSGGTVLMLPKFDAKRVLETIQAHGATIIHGVPTMYHSLLHFPDLSAYDTSTLQMCGSAGAAIPAEVIDEVERTFGVHILEMYGLTESGPLAAYNDPNDRKPYSIGKPIPGVEIQIWDEDNQPVPRGAGNVGEMVIRGHNTMSGYLNNAVATEEAFTNGWLHTGDLAYLDEDGFLFFVDRKKELIIRGGYNVYPREVEEVLYTNPKVSEAAVVGIPDARLGEEIKAYVTLKQGETGQPQEFVDYVKERLAAYKYPRVVEIIEEMPKSPTGKILKKELANSG